MEQGIKLTMVMKKTGAIHPEIQRFVKRGWVKPQGEPGPSGRRTIRAYSSENVMRIGFLHALMTGGIQAKLASSVLTVVDLMLWDLIRERNQRRIFGDGYNPFRNGLEHESDYLLHLGGRPRKKKSGRLEWDWWVSISYRDTDNGVACLTPRFGPLSQVKATLGLDQDGFGGSLPPDLLQGQNSNDAPFELQYVVNLTAISDRLKG